MIKAVFAMAAVAASALLVAANGSASPPAPNVTCSQLTQTFSGTAHDLTVPANGYCDIENATITHDLIVQHDSGGDLTNSTVGHDALYGDGSGGGITNSTIGGDLRLTSDGGADLFESAIGHDVIAGIHTELHFAASQIGHDVIANQPDTVQTGANDPTDVGHVQVGNDFIVKGSPGPPDPGAFVFDGMCDLSVGQDLRITDRWVTLGIGLGDNCAFNGRGPVTVGRDLVFSRNQALTGFFGPGELELGGVTVGRNLTVTGNSATGLIEVADNTVAGDATCRDNSPAASFDVFDGPNNIAGKNNGCP